MEHRWGERIVVDIPVQVSVPPSVIGTGRVVNISISGAWVSGRFDLPPLARAFVVFELVTGGMHEILPIACFVARVRPEGIGVEWRELAPQIVSDLMLFAAGTNTTRTNQARDHRPAAPLEHHLQQLEPVKTQAG